MPPSLPPQSFINPRLIPSGYAGLRNGSQDLNLDYVQSFEKISPRFDKGMQPLHREINDFNRRYEDSKIYANDPASHVIRLQPYRSRSNPGPVDRYAVQSSGLLSNGNNSL